MFVFGGDAFDRGAGDLRVARLLIDLKRRYPDRVVLIIGNRDANKMRLTSELAASELSRPLEECEGACPRLLDSWQRSLVACESVLTILCLVCGQRRTVLGVTAPPCGPVGLCGAPTHTPLFCATRGDPFAGGTVPSHVRAQHGSEPPEVHAGAHDGCSPGL